MAGLRIVGEPSVSERGVQVIIHSYRRSGYVPAKRCIEKGDQEWNRLKVIASHIEKELPEVFTKHVYKFICVDQQEHPGELLEQQFSWLKQ